MTARGLYTLIFGVIMLLTSLSVASAGAFLLGSVALIAFILSLTGVLFAFFTSRIMQQVQGGQTPRGSSCQYSLSVRLFSPVPLAPLQLRICMPDGRQSDFILPVRLFGETTSSHLFSCPHVGVFPVGAMSITFVDCFGLFTFSHAIKEPLACVTVLPNPRETKPLSYGPGEGESSIALRAQADRTTPEDTRLWQEGDELKRVHWKLSMRRQTLMVHTYETPQRPDALVLVDCSAPAMPDGNTADHSNRARMIDAITETAAGILKNLLDNHHLVRMPLSGEYPVELSGQDSDRFQEMQTALAQERFSRSFDFVRILMLSSRRMRRTGSTVVLSSRLSPAIADTLIALSKMGPHTRFVLISCLEPSDTQNQLLRLLDSSGIETELVRT